MNNIHIGCGYTCGKSWRNFDSTPIAFIQKYIFLNLIKINKKKFPVDVIYGDIVKKKLCKPNEADNIFCSHVLEHLSYFDSIKAVKNIYEMLKPGGVFRVVVPSLEERIDKYMIDRDANKFMKSLGCVNEDENNNLINKLRFLLGNSRHRWMFDSNSLKKVLSNAGFKDIRACKFNDSNIEVFSEVEEIGRFIENDLPAISFHCIK